MNGGFQLGFTYTTLNNNSSIFKTTIFSWSFHVIYKFTNDFETVFTQICGSNKGPLISTFYNSTKDIEWGLWLPLLLLLLFYIVAWRYLYVFLGVSEKER